VDQAAKPYYQRYEQHRETSKLRNRIQLHEKYRTYQYPWLLWVFDQLEMQPGLQVLEFSCGPGALWCQNIDRLPEGITCTLSDLSLPIIKIAREKLPKDGRFRFLVADIQDAPFGSQRFDVVIANQMLFHVPDLPRSILTIQRVLKPGGVLYATTNGLRHMYNIYELARQVAPGLRSHTEAAERFGLHNAARRLAPAFSHVQVTVYPDFLWVTDTEPLLEYIRSLWGPAELNAAQLEQLQVMIDSRIASEGGIHINKSTGIVKARRI
jgi:2-polyprenyl-3-methyl-5-hydroxy-6-metoxy-1,4-benzoquinol methylase